MVCLLFDVVVDMQLAEVETFSTFSRARNT